MSHILNFFSVLADFLGIVGFALTILTYLNTRKIKSNDAWVSFQLEKKKNLGILRNALGIIQECSDVSDVKGEQISSAVQATETVISLVDRIRHYPIWDDNSSAVFLRLMTSKTQIDKIKATQENDLGSISPLLINNDIDDILPALKNFASIAEEVIHIVENKS